MTKAEGPRAITIGRLSGPAPDRTASARPFAALAARYLACGITPFPVTGKEPAVKGYMRQFSQATIAEWAKRMPGCNLGLSTSLHGLIVLDADDADAALHIRAIAGPTPLVVRTKRGCHFYFRDPERRFRGTSRPQHRAYDIKASGRSDYVLLPGSRNGDILYAIEGYAGDDVPKEFAARLAAVPTLSRATYEQLARRPSSASLLPAVSSSHSVLHVGPRVAEGQRNQALFLRLCREAHDVRARFGDGAAALEQLTAYGRAFNVHAFETALPAAEIAKTARSAWQRTLNGTNRPPRTFRAAGPVRDALISLGRETRALAAWGWLSQQSQIPSRPEVTAADLRSAIPALSDHDAKAALVALAASGAMVVKQAGGRGRGRRVIYTLERTLVSRVDFAKALATLDGDHGAVALLAHLVEFAGADGRAPVSVLGMSEARSGRFARWTRCKLEKARVKLETTGLLVRDDDLRRGIRRPRAMFLVRAASVLKIPQNVPVDIHPPRPISSTAVNG